MYLNTPPRSSQKFTILFGSFSIQTQPFLKAKNFTSTHPSYLSEALRDILLPNGHRGMW